MAHGPTGPASNTRLYAAPPHPPGTAVRKPASSFRDIVADLGVDIAAVVLVLLVVRRWRRGDACGAGSTIRRPGANTVMCQSIKNGAPPSPQNDVLDPPSKRRTSPVAHRDAADFS